MAKMSGTLETL